MAEPTNSTPQKVYPRVCGGSVGGRRGRLVKQGLSPRVRGKHCPQADDGRA